MLYLILRSLTFILCKILFRLQVFGRENIPLKGSFILASNHTSYLDPPLLGAACPRVLSFLAKEELFKIAFLGRLISDLNVYPVNSQSGDFGSLRRAIRELKAGKPFTIFPEGRRTADGRLQEPMRGVGLLAAKAEVPIIPAFIEGSNRALPVHSKFIRPKKIKVYFGRALRPQGISVQLKGRDLYQAIAVRIMEEIGRLREKGNGEN